ncbi:hypothetical protein ACFPRL_33485 [Pseudoclavibacter helvolus]
MLSAAALRASAAATYARFDELFSDGQPADPTRQWLLTLPASYVAGAQVLMRSILADTEPVVLGDEHFTAEGFARAASELTADRRYVSLVPAQLARLLDAADSEAGTATSHRPSPASTRSSSAGSRCRQRFGRGPRPSAGTSRRATARARRAGELYNGEPLDGVKVRIRAGEVQLTGPVLASGYLGDRSDGGLLYRRGWRALVSHKRRRAPRARRGHWPRAARGHGAARQCHRLRG